MLYIINLVLLLGIAHISLAFTSLETSISQIDCNEDFDCLLPSERKGKKSVNNYFCVKGSCKPLKAPGWYCSKGSECASYIYYGNHACSDTCGIDALCHIQKGLHPNGYEEPTQKCCREIPLHGECNPTLDIPNVLDLLRKKVDGDVSFFTDYLKRYKKISNKPRALSGCRRKHGFVCLPKKIIQTEDRIQWTCETRHATPNEIFEWKIGIFLCILTGIIQGIALNLQKFALLIVNEEKKELHVSLVTAISIHSYRRKGFPTEKLPSHKIFSKYRPLYIWLIGLIFYVLGTIINFVSYFYASQILVAPLGSIVLIVNAILAKYLNGEVFSKYYDTISIIMILLGTFTVVFSSKKSESSYSLCELISFYGRFEMQIVAGWSLILIAATWLVNCFFTSSSSDVDCLTNDKFDQSYSETEETALFGKLKHWLYPLTFTFMSGTYGAYVSILSKSIAELVSDSLDGDNQFTVPMTWLLLTALILIYSLKIYWVNQGLFRFSALLMIPLGHTCVVAMSEILGGVYFGEFSRFTTERFAAFISGIFIICFGSFVLISKHPLIQ